MTELFTAKLGGAQLVGLMYKGKLVCVPEEGAKDIAAYLNESVTPDHDRLVEAVRKAYEFADEVYWHDPENSEQAGEMAKHFQDVLKELGEW